MQRLLYVILFAITVQLGFAQQATISVVHLKNGSVVKGKMFSSKSGNRVKVETPDGSVVFFTKNAITEVSKENYSETSFAEGESTLYLQNESVINGKIRKAKNSDRMRIETPSGSIVYFTESSVLDIVRSGESTAAASQRQTTSSATRQATQPPVADQRTQPVKSDVVPSESVSGYRGIIEAGYSIKMGEISTNRIEITTSHGYQINNRIFIGLGAGVNLYSDGLYYNGVVPWTHAENAVKDTMNVSIAIPIFADFRFNFLDKGSVIPFAGLKLGYTLGFQDSELETVSSGEEYSKTEVKAAGLGIYAQPSVGVKFMLGKSAALNVSLGYAMQTFEHYYILNGIQYKKQKNNGGINLRVGFEF